MALIHGRYAVLRQLRATLFGAVFLCRDTQRNGHHVVLKQVELQRAVQLLDAAAELTHQLDDPREERAAARRLREAPDHPHIVRYLDEFVEDEQLFFVLELCAGGDLYELARRQPDQRLPCGQVLAIVGQIASAAAFLHAQGIAHRDVSLENVFLTEHSACKLGDFGLAVDARHLCFQRAGKGYYMAPEVVAADESFGYDPKAADVWSLGILMFILLSGSPLVAEASSADCNAFQTIAHAGVREILDAWGVSVLMEGSAIELLDGMLQVDAGMRLTMEQVLQHEALVDWRTNAGVNL